MRGVRLTGAALFAVLAATPAKAGFCKLALVLALDISSSVNAREYRIQLEGVARALRVDMVQQAILSPHGAGVAVLAFEWSGVAQQALIADWTLLDSRAAIERFAERLIAHRRSADDQSTAVGEALAFAARQFARAPDCARRTIDISGDGENNVGTDPDPYRAAGLFDGITINGLVVQGAYPNPVIYYRAHVMQGPDAFVAMARHFGDYPPVIIGKLLREIGQAMILGDRR